MKPNRQPLEPTEQEIQHAAYFLWEESGKPKGCDLDIWLAAKERLKHSLPVRRARVLRGPTMPTLSTHTVDAIAAD